MAPRDDNGRKPWSAAFHDLDDFGPDYRFLGPTEICACGNCSFAAIVHFKNNEISSYFTDIRCLMCGAYLIAPTGESKEGKDDDE